MLAQLICVYMAVQSMLLGLLLPHNRCFFCRVTVATLPLTPCANFQRLHVLQPLLRSAVCSCPQLKWSGAQVSSVKSWAKAAASARFLNPRLTVSPHCRFYSLLSISSQCFVRKRPLIPRITGGGAFAVSNHSPHLCVKKSYVEFVNLK